MNFFDLSAWNEVLAITLLLAIVLVTSLIGAVVLRAACALYNKMVGGEESDAAVHRVGFTRGAAIVLISIVVTFVANAIISMIASWGLWELYRVHLRNAQDKALLSLLSIPVDLLVTAILVQRMLPTSFLRAAIVSFIYYVIFFVISVVVIVVIAFVVGPFALLDP